MARRRIVAAVAAVVAGSVLGAPLAQAEVVASGFSCGFFPQSDGSVTITGGPVVAADVPPVRSDDGTYLGIVVRDMVLHCDVVTSTGSRTRVQGPPGVSVAVVPPANVVVPLVRSDLCSYVTYSRPGMPDGMWHMGCEPVIY